MDENKMYNASFYITNFECDTINLYDNYKIDNIL